MHDLDRAILEELQRLTAAAADISPAMNHSLTGPARKAAAGRLGREREAAKGWFPCPTYGTAPTRSRSVKRLLAAGLVEERGQGRGRELRLLEGV